MHPIQIPANHYIEEYKGNLQLSEENKHRNNPYEYQKLNIYEDEEDEDFTNIIFRFVKRLFNRACIV